jgi:hypothetical protein
MAFDIPTTPPRIQQTRTQQNSRKFAPTRIFLKVVDVSLTALSALETFVNSPEAHAQPTEDQAFAQELIVAPHTGSLIWLPMWGDVLPLVCVKSSVRDPNYGTYTVQLSVTTKWPVFYRSRTFLEDEGRGELREFATIDTLIVARLFELLGHGTRGHITFAPISEQTG